MAKTVVSKPGQTITNPQVNFTRPEFDDAIWDKGYLAFIDRALHCPCKVKASGTPLSSCMNCGGTGWIYIDRQETRILCSSMSNRNKYENWTQENMGTVNISTRPQDKLGFMDKVTLLELESWFSQVLHLNKSTTQPTKLFAFLLYPPVGTFDVYKFVSSGQPLEYLDESKYTIDNNKILLNLSDFTGIQNPTITVRYVHNPAYYIIDMNRDLIRQKQGVNCKMLENNYTNLPINAIGRRAHYVLDASNFAGDQVYDNTNYERVPPKYDY